MRFVLKKRSHNREDKMRLKARHQNSSGSLFRVNSNTLTYVPKFVRLTTWPVAAGDGAGTVYVVVVVVVGRDAVEEAGAGL